MHTQYNVYMCANTRKQNVKFSLVRHSTKNYDSKSQIFVSQHGDYSLEGTPQPVEIQPRPRETNRTTRRYTVQRMAHIVQNGLHHSSATVTLSEETVNPVKPIGPVHRHVIPLRPQTIRIRQCIVPEHVKLRHQYQRRRQALQRVRHHRAQVRVENLPLQHLRHLLIHLHVILWEGLILLQVRPRRMGRHPRRHVFVGVELIGVGQTLVHVHQPHADGVALG